jgi:hypothetical protein
MAIQIETKPNCAFLKHAQTVRNDKALNVGTLLTAPDSSFTSSADEEALTIVAINAQRSYITSRSPGSL